jgi:predicted metal-binding membrane protein
MATSGAPVRDRPVRVRPEHVVLTVAAAAWAALVLPAASGAAHAHTTATSPGALPAVLAGWAVMVAAMMLPPTLPLVRTLAALDAGRARLPVLGVGAVLGVWLTVGAALIAVAGGVALLLPATARAHEVVVGIALSVAGAYQFTPLKAACLTACRTPRWFVLRYWHGRSAVAETARIGAAYGVACVGCCWALMALCVVGGATALPSMVVLTALMAVERLTPRGRRAARTAGRLLILAGAAAVLGVLPDPLALLLVGAH